VKDAVVWSMSLVFSKGAVEFENSLSKLSFEPMVFNGVDKAADLTGVAEFAD